MSRERELLEQALSALWEEIPAHIAIKEISAYLASPEAYKRTTPLDVMEIMAIYYTYHPEAGEEFSALAEAFAEGVRLAEVVHGIRGEE